MFAKIFKLKQHLKSFTSFKSFCFRSATQNTYKKSFTFRRVFIITLINRVYYTRIETKKQQLFIHTLIYFS